jgi:hypothetical protein
MPRADDTHSAGPPSHGHELTGLSSTCRPASHTHVFRGRPAEATGEPPGHIHVFSGARRRAARPTGR